MDSAVANTRPYFGGLNMSFWFFRLVLLCVAATMFASPSVHARGRRYGRRGRGGYGWGTQWMQNPYQGYLSGAANLTIANAQYQLSIQQARLLREDARRSALQTRQATLEEHEYERSLQPDPEQIREEKMLRSLQRSRNNPPLVEIWSGSALNDLLRDIESGRKNGDHDPDVPLAPDVLKHINVTNGTTPGGIGLLRERGKLTWPNVLQQSSFAQERKRLDELLPQAVKEAHTGPVRAELLDHVRSSLKQLEDALDTQAAEMTPSEFTEASRYVRELKDSVQALQQSDVSKYFSHAWTPKGSTVKELVQQMTREGLRFAPAVSGDEQYYTSLHRALVDYDMGVARLTTVQSPR
jgi:hypothetical protein